MVDAVVLHPDSGDCGRCSRLPRSMNAFNAMIESSGMSCGGLASTSALLLRLVVATGSFANFKKSCGSTLVSNCRDVAPLQLQA